VTSVKITLHAKTIHIIQALIRDGTFSKKIFIWISVLTTLQFSNGIFDVGKIIFRLISYVTRGYVMNVNRKLVCTHITIQSTGVM
jgi:hypothetical protein